MLLHNNYASARDRGQDSDFSLRGQYFHAFTNVLLNQNNLKAFSASSCAATQNVCPNSKHLFCINCISILSVSWSHCSKNHQFIQKFTLWKSQFLQNSPNENHIFHKIHIFKVSIFTISHSENRIFTKFTFFKHQFLGNFRIKS